MVVWEGHSAPARFESRGRFDRLEGLAAPKWQLPLPRSTIAGASPTPVPTWRLRIRARVASRLAGWVADATELPYRICWVTTTGLDGDV